MWGGFHVRLGKRRFPGKFWTDFAVVLLGWWLDALSNLLAARTTQVEVPFMEGPYSVRVRRTSKRVWVLELVERRQAEERLQAFSISPSDLVDSVVAAAGIAMRIVRERGWGSPDSERIDAALGRLGRATRGG